MELPKYKKKKPPEDSWKKVCSAILAILASLAEPHE
jgi:hypothetical protein